MRSINYVGSEIKSIELEFTERSILHVIYAHDMTWHMTHDWKKALSQVRALNAQRLMEVSSVSDSL